MPGFTGFGRQRISRFLNELAKPHVTLKGLEEAYRAMAEDEERERERRRNGARAS